MKRFVDVSKVILLDTLGVLLMAASVLLGWVPGPGGIPLFLIGLSLLAINHEWASRLQVRVRDTGAAFLSKIFSSNPKVQLMYDCAGIIIVGLGVWVILNGASGFQLWPAISGILIGLVLLIGNRGRWPRLKKFLNKQIG